MRTELFEGICFPSSSLPNPEAQQMIARAKAGADGPEQGECRISQSLQHQHANSVELFL